MAEQLPLEERQGEPRIEDIFYQHDVLTAQGLIYVLGQTDLAHRVPNFFLLWPRRIAVAGYANEVEGGIQLDLPHQVAQKHRRAFEDSNKDNRRLAISGDLPAHFGDALRDLLTRDQEFKLLHSTNILLYGKFSYIEDGPGRPLECVEHGRAKGNEFERGQTYLVRSRNLSHTNTQRQNHPYRSLGDGKPGLSGLGKEFGITRRDAHHAWARRPYRRCRGNRQEAQSQDCRYPRALRLAEEKRRERNV